MLSDEEKKAIENVEKFVYSILNGISAYDCKVVLNLIEKKSKEIEELKKEYERVRAGRNWLSEHISAQIATPELFDRLVEENYISKDKIKAKIEEYEKEKELYDKDADREWGQYNNWDWIDSFINELQALLEKE